LSAVLAAGCLKEVNGRRAHKEEGIMAKLLVRVASVPEEESLSEIGLISPEASLLHLMSESQGADPGRPSDRDPFLDWLDRQAGSTR
jgi:hypothetical protein